MNKLVIVASLLAASASSQALAAPTHYTFCFGGGRAALYYSAVFPTDQGTKTADTANAFNAFVKGKYGTMIHSECRIMDPGGRRVDKRLGRQRPMTEIPRLIRRLERKANRIVKNVRQLAAGR